MNAMDGYIEKIASRATKGDEEDAAPDESDPAEESDSEEASETPEDAAHDLLAAISEYMQGSFGPNEKDPAVQKLRAKQKAALCTIVVESIKEIASKE